KLLVRELHKRYVDRKLNVYSIYLSGSAEGLYLNESVLGVNPRSPLNFFRIRRILTQLQKETKKEKVTVHVHLTWPFFYAALASIGLENIRLIYTEHNTTNRRRRIPLFWVLERLIYSRYAQIICISQGVHDALAK